MTSVNEKKNRHMVLLLLCQFGVHFVRRSFSLIL